MTWELVFDIHEGQVDLEGLTDALLEHGALSVSVEDLMAGEAGELPRFGEPGSPTDIQSWPISHLRVLLGRQLDPRDWWVLVSAAESSLASLPMAYHRVEEADWVATSQAAFDPIVIEDRLWIGPHWHRPPADFTVAPRLSLSIDPAMAFGTGGHPTTELCLRALLGLYRIGQSSRGPRRVLDLGCGSGILAIAAAALGASEVTAIDIDPLALETTGHNAHINHVGDRIRIQTAATCQSSRYDLVMANILAQPLKLLAPSILRAVDQGGGLILSGLLSRQEQEIRTAYAEVDPVAASRMTRLFEQDGWLCFGFWPESFQTQPS